LRVAETTGERGAGVGQAGGIGNGGAVDVGDSVGSKKVDIIADDGNLRVGKISRERGTRADPARGIEVICCRGFPICAGIRYPRCRERE
jgi:hypothetical protein